MFVWPDSIPPGAEYIFVSLVPLGLLNADRFPFFTAIQVASIALLAWAAVLAWRRFARARLSMALLFVGYPVVVFATNLALFLWMDAA